MLHLVAKNYGTDPESVLSWSPRRLGLAIQCLDAAQALTERRSVQAATNGGLIAYTVTLGGL